MNKDVIIIAIGRELVNGRTLDTNSRYLARNMTILGLRVASIHVIDDIPADIVKTIKRALAEKPWLVITTGGLGPTVDDMTLQAVAKALNKGLVKNKKAMAMLGKRYDELYRKGLLHTKGWNEGRIKMGIMPAGAKPLKNPVGTAPAAFIKKDGTALFCLPGVPAEAQAFFDTSILAWIKQHAANSFWFEQSLVTKSYDESVLRILLDKVSAAFPDVYIKSSPAGFLKEKSLEVFFTSAGKDKAYVRDRVNGAMDRVKKLLHN